MKDTVWICIIMEVIYGSVTMVQRRNAELEYIIPDWHIDTDKSFKIFLKGDFFSVLYSTRLHLPSLGLHCAEEDAWIEPRTVATSALATVLRNRNSNFLKWRNQNHNKMESQKMRWQIPRQQFCFYEHKKARFFTNFFKTAFYGLNREPELGTWYRYKKTELDWWLTPIWRESLEV